MLDTILGAHEKIPVYAEGELYRIIRLHDHTFHLYYGYYEDCERENPAIDPMPIYPDFLKNPQHTSDGFPFVTKMQDACQHYKGNKDRFSECAECEYYAHGDELLGICVCPQNRLKPTTENHLDREDLV
ncbi:MAG: hypothetical protein IJC17_05115 [Clostridia bacterium]|nr:hypothetical protein [Clostridia bacterium]